MLSFKGTKRVAFAATCVIGGLMPALLPAQEGEADQARGGLDEIIVTAQKRAESAQDVPASLTAFDEKAISRTGIATIEDVTTRTPGFKMTRFNLSEPQFYIRGVGSTSDSAAGDPTVGVFLDEIYVGRISGAAFDLFDLERIEVLRGPQGTLYGRNTSGGAVNVITAKPTDEFYARARVGFGNYDLYEMRGVINGPLGDRVNGKLSVSHREHGGYSKQIVTGSDLMDEDNWSVRAQLAFNPSEITRLLVGLDYSKDDTNGNGRVPYPVFGDTPTGPLIRLLYPADRDIRLAYSDPASFQSRDIKGVMARLEHDAAFGTWTVLGGWRQTEVDWFEDLGTLPSPPWVTSIKDYADEDAKQYSLEARLSSSAGSPIKWVVGAFLFSETVDRNEGFRVTFAPLPAAGGDVTFIQNVDSDSYAAFGQLTYPFTDRFSVTAGLRYSHDAKDAHQVGRNNDPADPTPGIPLFPGQTYDVTASDSWDSVTGKLSFEYRTAGGQLAYLSVDRGFKSGIFPSQNNVVQNVGQATPPEKNLSYELGAKTEWLQRRLRANVALFAMDYTDVQLFRLDPQLRLVTFTEDATINGAEIELALAPTEALQLGATYAYLDAEVDGGPNDGHMLTRAPESSYGVYGEYGVPVPGGSVSLRAEYQWTDDLKTEVPNSRISVVPSYGLFDARIAYSIERLNLEVSVWGKNLTDEEYPVNIIPFLGNGFSLFGPPRTYGLSLSWRAD